MSHSSTPTQAVTTEEPKQEDNSLSNYHTGLITLSVLILISNLFAIQIYKRHIKVRRNLSNVLLVSLSISDLIAGVVVLPFGIYCEREYSLDNITLIHAARVSYILQNFCGFSTILHIITVTIEKYIAVLHPFQRINIATSSAYTKILLILWTTALLFALIPCFWLFEHPKTASWEEKVDNYGIFQIAVFFGVSVIILSYCYCRMFIQIYGKLADRSQTARVQIRVRNERKTIIVFVMFFALFVIGWLPWFMISLKNPSPFPDLSPAVVDFLISLRFAGALLNPFIYAFLKNDYKEAVQTDLERLFSSCCPMPLRKFRQRRPRGFSESNFDQQHTTDTVANGVKLMSFRSRLPNKSSVRTNSSFTSSCHSPPHGEETDL